MDLAVQGVQGNRIISTVFSKNTNTGLRDLTLLCDLNSHIFNLTLKSKDSEQKNPALVNTKNLVIACTLCFWPLGSNSWTERLQVIKRNSHSKASMRNPQVIIAKEKPLVAMGTWKATLATLRADQLFNKARTHSFPSPFPQTWPLLRSPTMEMWATSTSVPKIC